MTRTPNTPGTDDSDTRLMSARIPWRERQGLLLEQNGKTPRTGRAKTAKKNRVASRRETNTSKGSAQIEASSTHGSSWRHSLATTRPASGGGRKKRGGRATKNWKSNAEEKHFDRVSFGGLSFSVTAMTVLLLAVLAALLTVPTMAQMWRQHLTYADIKQRVATTQAANDEMRAELERWKDPAYVAAQARIRLGYVRPGETEYTVADSGQTSLAATTTPTGPAKPWVQVLALTMQAADDTGTDTKQLKDVSVPETGNTEDDSAASGGQSGAVGGDSPQSEGKN